jgi:hypothetical protein
MDNAKRSGYPPHNTRPAIPLYERDESNQVYHKQPQPRGQSDNRAITTLSDRAQAVYQTAKQWNRTRNNTAVSRTFRFSARAIGGDTFHYPHHSIAV